MLTTLALADDAQLQKFTASAPYQALISQKLSQYPAEVFHRCPALVSKGSKITILKPVSFADDGHPTAGLWHQAFPVSGCGNDTTINLFFIVKPDKTLNVLAGLSGTTLADPLLQKDALMAAVAAATRPETKDCKDIHVVNTEFVGIVGEAMEGAKGKPWDELWTISSCQKRAIVTMHFLPDKTGTGFRAALRETKFPN